MLLMVLRKMIKNRWMVLCLMVGSIIAVAMVSSIPMYTDAILQRLLVKDIEQIQTDKEVYAGRYLIDAQLKDFFGDNACLNAFNTINTRQNEEFVNQLKMPVAASAAKIVAEPLIGRRSDGVESRRISFSAVGMTGLFEKVAIKSGKLPATEVVDGCYEVMVSEQCMNEFDLALGAIYSLTDNHGRYPYEVRIKIVGTFAYDNANDPYWYTDISQFNKALVMDYTLLYNNLINIDATQSMVKSAAWYYAFDYTQLSIDDIAAVSASLQEQTDWLQAAMHVKLDMPAMPVIGTYVTRAAQLQTTDRKSTLLNSSH